VRVRALVVAAVLLAGCGAGADDAARQPEPADVEAATPTAETTPTPTPGTPRPPEPDPSVAESPPPHRPPETDAPAVPAPTEATVVESVPYRVEMRTDDPATADFADTVHAILTDPRGWVRAGFVFVRDPQAPYRIVIAEGDEVDRLCHPYRTRATYSCQNGPVVAINADRWRSATPQWPADLDGYRIMLINHEVGHLLHLHHPDPQCPGAGLPAPVMAQQSTSLGECLPNPWPLRWEVDLAAQRSEPLAPGPEHDPSDHRPSPPAVTR
jgi:hypothetical protein